MSLALDAFADAQAALGPPSMAQIKREVAARHGLTPAQLEGPSRERLIAHVRHEAMWRCRQIRRPGGKPRFGLLQIGRQFGDRDHTTVLFACRAHERRMAEEAGRADLSIPPPFMGEGDHEVVERAAAGCGLATIPAVPHGSEAQKESPTHCRTPPSPPPSAVPLPHKWGRNRDAEAAP